MIHARAGRAEAARQDYAACRKAGARDSLLAYLDGVLAAHLDDSENALSNMERLIEKDPEDARLLYDAACVYAVTYEARTNAQESRNSEYARRAAELLARPSTRTRAKAKCTRSTQTCPLFAKVTNTWRYSA